MTHPVQTLWQRSGRPEPNWQGKAVRTVSPPESRQGICALTGLSGQVWPVSKVTTTLTTLDRLPFRNLDPAGLALGPAAAWAIRHRLAMQQPHVSEADGRLVSASPNDLRAALENLGPRSWVLVPQSRQKHLLPWAVPGQVRVDDESLPWTKTDVALLATYARLRRLGFVEVALAESAPRWHVLQRLANADRQWALTRWRDLSAWRSHLAYLDVAARATRTPRQEGDHG
jgi:hypothetical protein